MSSFNPLYVTPCIHLGHTYSWLRVIHKWCVHIVFSQGESSETLRVSCRCPFQIRFWFQGLIRQMLTRNFIISGCYLMQGHIKGFIYCENRTLLREVLVRDTPYWISSIWSLMSWSIGQYLVLIVWGFRQMNCGYE